MKKYLKQIIFIAIAIALLFHAIYFIDIKMVKSLSIIINMFTILISIHTITLIKRNSK